MVQTELYKQHCLLPLSLNNLHTTTYHHHTIISCKERPLTFRPDRLCAITCPRKQAHRWFMLVSAPRYSSGYEKLSKSACAASTASTHWQRARPAIFKGPSSRYFQPQYVLYVLFSAMTSKSHFILATAKHLQTTRDVTVTYPLWPERAKPRGAPTSTLATRVALAPRSK